MPRGGVTASGSGSASMTSNTSFARNIPAPEFAVRYFPTYVCTEPKNCDHAPPTAAVDRTIENFLRHQLTDY